MTITEANAIQTLCRALIELGVIGRLTDAQRHDLAFLADRSATRLGAGLHGHQIEVAG